MDNPALELLGPTRKALVLAIKARGSATAEELGETCYLSPAAARVHLAGMERMGLVSHANKSAGPGRPKNQYFLTQSGEDLFPHCEAGFAIDLINVMARVPEWGAALETHQAEAVGREVRGATPNERVQSLADSPRLQKYFPELSEDAEGAWKVTMRHCPFLAVARAHPSLCELETRVFARALGEDFAVANHQNRVTGHDLCQFYIAAANTPESAGN